MTRKITTLLPVLILTFFSPQLFAQVGVWTQKANFGGGSVTEARAFSIGNFGYFGWNTSALWQYDPQSYHTLKTNK